MELKAKFTDVYDRGAFGGKDSESGPGSDLVQTARIRTAIPLLIARHRIRSVLDAPCGDWFWMQRTKLDVDHYIGADIVEPVIERNRRKFGRKGVDFVCLDLTNDVLPKADLILTRDCLVHLSYADALKMIANFKRSGARYLLTTTFVARRANFDLGASFWRPLNLQLAPFSFPAPVAMINEGCTEPGNFGDKSLGLWALDSLDV